MRQPHVKDGPPVSLWWYRRSDRQRVIDAYVAQCKRGRALPESFRDDLRQWLADLSRVQKKSDHAAASTERYWDARSYARAHNLKPFTFMKRLREMNKIAKRMFPDSIPPSRKDRAPLTEKEVKEIKKAYLDGTDAKELAVRFDITAARVGQLCREEKAMRAAKRKAEQDGIAQPAKPPDDLEYPF